MLPNSDGSTWQNLDEANLSLSITPSSTEDVLLSANADLWTWNAGYNQDLGIAVAANGGTTRVVAWKESGGFAGTFSPNAAYVETDYRMTAGTQYSVWVVWKTNKPAIGASISAGAGGPAPYSPTRLNAQVMTGANAVTSVVSTQQYNLSNSNGSTWQPIDGTNLSLSLSPSANENVVLSGNADLWTWNAGYNQDLGIAVSGTGDATVVAWKESGGFGGTFSPNAAFVQTVDALTGGATYTVQLVWKTNKNAPGAQITAGAGPIGAAFSPTRLTAYVLPGLPPSCGTCTSNWETAVSTSQHSLANSSGVTWQPMDTNALQMVFKPLSTGNVLVSVNADLWTASAGYNQDIALFVTDNGGAPILLGWKELGGFAGTFSPNAAFLQVNYPVLTTHSYVITVEWKTNKPASGATIYAGAGPISGLFSPTRLSVVPA